QLNESTRSSEYAISFRRLMEHWFEAYGVVVLDPRDKALKSLFQEHMRKELFGEVRLQQSVSSEITEWNSRGYDEAVHVRDINLFYFHEHGRYRIQRNDSGFELVGSDVRWTHQEASDLCIHYPERFSPNVVMRPIYQETILPNVAYVGGPAEVAYWLQLMPAFQAFGMEAPSVFLRNHLTLVDENTDQRCTKIQVSPEEAVSNRDEIIRRWINIDLAPMERAKEDIQQVMMRLRAELSEFDVNLGAAADAEMHRIESGLVQLEKKWAKSMRMKEETSIKQLDTIRERLIPGGSPHERHDAMALWWARGGDELFRRIYLEMESFKPEWLFLHTPSSPAEI
ncbi:MAG: bacillithiol biosynthesis BshC, partial [Flavobacteriales bacterium]